MKINNELQHVTFEQAKKLRDAGFDWRVYALYQRDGTFIDGCSVSDGHYGYAAPKVTLALKWMREVKGFVFEITIYRSGGNTHYSACIQRASGHDVYVKPSNYSAVESALLDELLTLIENEK